MAEKKWYGRGDLPKRFTLLPKSSFHGDESTVARFNCIDLGGEKPKETLRLICNLCIDIFQSCQYAKLIFR